MHLAKINEVEATFTLSTFHNRNVDKSFHCDTKNDVMLQECCLRQNISIMLLTNGAKPAGWGNKVLVQNQSDWTGKARQGSAPYLELIGLFTLPTMLLCFSNGMLTKIVIFPQLC